MNTTERFYHPDKKICSGYLKKNDFSPPSLHQVRKAADMIIIWVVKRNFMSWEGIEKIWKNLKSLSSLKKTLSLNSLVKVDPTQRFQKESFLK